MFSSFNSVDPEAAPGVLLIHFRLVVVRHTVPYWDCMPNIERDSIVGKFPFSCGNDLADCRSDRTLHVWGMAHCRQSKMTREEAD